MLLWEKSYEGSFFLLHPVWRYNWEEGAEDHSGQSLGLLPVIRLCRGTDSKQSSLSPEVTGGNSRQPKLDEERYRLNLEHGALHTHRASGVYRHGRRICPQRNRSRSAHTMETYEFRSGGVVWTS